MMVLLCRVNVAKGSCLIIICRLGQPSQITEALTVPIRSCSGKKSSGLLSLVSRESTSTRTISDIRINSGVAYTRILYRGYEYLTGPSVILI